MYDIAFISYNEPNAEENWINLKSKFSRAQRINGVKGIHQAHIAAAKKCFTKMFWVVDGDAVIQDDFNFSHIVDDFDIETVHVWRSINPINDLTYGYGGVKLLPRKLTKNMRVDSPDMTTSIGKYFKPMQQISNITAFNTDPFNTWKSAFRECAKLASRAIDRQNEEETNQRLKIWTTVGHNRPFGEYAILGATAGKAYGENNRLNISLINDFDWLKEKFDATC